MTSSSSASGTSGSGSGSSQSVPSSMESSSTLPMQDVVDGDFSEQDEAEDLTWGKLIPLGRCFTLHDLEKGVYHFGRDTNCDVCFRQFEFRKNPHFPAMSKKHFALIEETCSNDADHVVYIKDLSSNGTFLNGVLIGKGNKQVIQTSDEIALASPTNKAYTFLDLKATSKEQEKFPQEVKEKFTFSKVLGRGVCGEVRLAFSKGNECKKVAIKIINKRNFSLSNQFRNRSISQEVEILKKLDHPCIVKVFDAVDTPDSLYIVLELVEGGELFDRVTRLKKLEEPFAKLLFYQMLLAVKYLHDKGFTHRDLKPENVLLSSADNATLIKITDFGLSKFVGEQSLMQTLCGTPSYLAPEVLASEGNRSYKKQCDCWSLGVILFVCLSGCPPFANRPNNPLKKQVLSGSYAFRPESKWRDVSEEAKDLIRKLLTVDPEARISVTKALEHPWMQDEEMIKKAKRLMEPGTSESKQMGPPSETTTKRKLSSDSDSSTSTKRHKSKEDTI